MARAVLSRHRPRVVGITGSMGKTTTKQAVAAVLQTRFSVRASSGNFNNEIGLPLSVLGVSSGLSGFSLGASVFLNFFRSFFTSQYPEMLVLEMGADKVGDIAYLTRIAPPHIGLVTRVAEAHTQNFGDVETIQKEKAKIVSALSHSGLAVLNADDARVMAMSQLHKGKIITFGLSEGADVRAMGAEVTQRLFGPEFRAEADLGTKFMIRYNGASYRVEVSGLLGLPQVYALLAGFAAGVSLGIGPKHCAEALIRVAPVPGRLRPISGIKNTIVLDDTYNSSPDAAVEALKVLKQVRARRRLAVLGDMLELGAQTETAHRHLGRIARDLGVDLLFTVGERARFIAEEAWLSGFAKSKIFEFETTEDAAIPLQNKLAEADAVLIKGSQGVRMEKIVLEIMAHPQDASELLCRQEPKWQKPPK